MAENVINIPSSFHAWIQFYAQFNTLPASPFPILDPFSTPTSSVLCLIRMRLTNSFNQTIALTIPVLITFLQLKYQNKSPFLTHPITMAVAVCTSLLYYLAYVAALQFPLRRRFAALAHHCSVSSGYVSIASLASVLLPDSVSPFVYAVFALLSASGFLYWLYRKFVEDEDSAEFQAYRRRVRRLMNNIFRVVRNSSRQWQQTLPL